MSPDSHGSAPATSSSFSGERLCSDGNQFWGARFRVSSIDLSNSTIVTEAFSLFRSCSCETCEFSGTYSDLRKHARLQHPGVRPSEADPERQRSWRRLERQRDLGDLISTLQSSFGDDGILFDDGGWLTVFFLIRVLKIGLEVTMNKFLWRTSSANLKF